MNRLQRLHEAGVSIWLDTLSRELLESGEFARLVRNYAVSGATSNPTIFAKAITGSDRYDEQLRALDSAGVSDTTELFFAIALDDVRSAAVILRPVYERTGGGDGFISFECTPDVADDAEATVEQALDLWRRLSLPNVLIKVPATEAGVAAIEELTAAGVNVNVTLLLSVERYEEVIEAYLRGLERRVAAGEPVAGVSSVASFFGLALRCQGRRRARATVAAARPGGDRQRPSGLRALPVAVWRRALEGAATRRRDSAAAAVGQHWDQGSGLLRRPLRGAADRPRRDQHDA
jgi:hypothetical protein